ncbi:SAMHD1 [Mytilus edulis]|uniref:Deoxynucleoside triphosphate triphosphohydrolase SAMHD1 n=1 Tax=Mytilus edulis TaxID=6550 RepID=A0A8S3V4X2_MYTED|nr:SAMHD1 [Mytilus edulis]
MDKLEKEQLYNRLQQFYDEIVMLVVHIYFEREFLKNGDLGPFLQNENHAIFHEFFPKTKCCQCKDSAYKTSTRKVCLGQNQFDKLYVSSGTEISHHEVRKGSIIKQHCSCKFVPRQHVKVKDLDIILIYAIISSCFDAVSPPGYPELFMKIKNIRNDIVHIGRGYALSFEDFNAKWDILEQTSLEIARLTCETHQQGIKNKSPFLMQILLTVLNNLPTVILDESGLKYSIEQLTYQFKNVDVQIATRTSNRDENNKNEKSAVSELPWRDKDKSKERSVGITCDQLKQTVNAYLRHNHKCWKRCASLSQPTVEITSTKQEEDTQPSTSAHLFVEEGYISLTKEDVAKKLEDHSLYEAAKVFREEDISGNVLDMLDDERLEQMGITAMGEKLQIMKVIMEITRVKDLDLEEHKKKIFNDPVHGHIEVHPLCIKIIDTPQFQRLRDLKQSGTCYFVYPGATNNRFEHCIGVCNLAGKLVRMLQKRQPELKITNKDILCVEIAGLCHDLGHGPFSHLFDNKFIATVRPTRKWKHEVGSVMMFEYLIEKHHLMGEFNKYGLMDQDIEFIKEQIAGPKVNEERAAGSTEHEEPIAGLKTEKSVWPYRGRDHRKGFLYEVSCLSLVTEN